MQKHFSITNKKKQSIESTTVSIYTNGDSAADGSFIAMFNVNLSEVERQELDADAILLTDLAKHVYLYWERHFEQENT